MSASKDVSPPIAQASSVVKMDDLPSISFTTHLNDTLAPAWDKRINELVIAIWVLWDDGLDDHEAAHGWRVAIETKDGHVVTLHPVYSETTSSIDIVIRPFCATAVAAKSPEFKTMISSSKAHYGRAATASSTTMKMVLEALDKSGIHHYKLQNGDGLQFWLCLALYQIAEFTKELRNYDALKDIAVCQMGKRSTDGTIKKVVCVPHKLTGKAFQLYRACSLRVDSFNEMSTMLGA